MALVGNRSVLLKSPGKFLSGTVASIERSNFNKPGMAAGRFSAMSPVFAGIPTGHLAPSSWSLPRVAGALSAINAAVATMDVAPLNLAAGRNLAGEATFSFSVPGASLELIVSAAGAATATFTVSGVMVGAVEAAGAASATFTVSAPTLGAIINAVGAATASMSGAATISAIGHLAGDITPYTELSPQNLAASVWGALIADIQAAGTAGEALATAGAGGLSPTQADWLEALAKIHGLVIGAPLTVSSNAREAGGVEQTIAEAAGVVTVERVA